MNSAAFTAPDWLSDAVSFNFAIAFPHFCVKKMPWGLLIDTYNIKYYSVCFYRRLAYKPFFVPAYMQDTIRSDFQIFSLQH